MLRQESRERNIQRGVFSRVAKSILVSSKIVSQIWYEGNEVLSTSGVAPNFPSSMKQINLGRKKVELSSEQIKYILLRCRINVRSLSKALRMSKLTVIEGFKRDVLDLIQMSLNQF